MREQLGIALVTLTALTSCFGGGTPTQSAGSHAAIDDKAKETFSYAPAENRHIRASVDQVLMAGDEGFLPKDRNWLQMRVSVSNIGSRALQLTDVKAKMEDGVAISAAQTGAELAKSPNLLGMGAKYAGISVAGAAAGMLLFPPLAVVGAAAGVASLFGGMGSWQKRLDRIHRTMLSRQDIAPGTTAQGYVYLPALRGQDALLVYYNVNGVPETMTVRRAGR